MLYPDRFIRTLETQHFNKNIDDFIENFCEIINRVVGEKNHSSFFSASFELPYILLITSFKKVLQCQEDVALLQTRLIIEMHNGMR